jgi:serine/threonine protein kinase
LLHQGDFEVVNFPQLYWYGSEGDYNGMAMELCGPCLEDLFNYCIRKFSLKTVLMMGEQMLHRIEFLHMKGLVHRDIKPENFVFGVNEKSHHLMLIDFGLSKRYWDNRTRTHIPFKEGKPLTGTARYCSANTHRGFEQSRRDDLESIGFLLIYFLAGSLPWQGIAAPDAQTKTIKIGEKKISTPLEELCVNCPPELLNFVKYCRQLKFPDAPDYGYLRGMLREAFSREGYTYDWIYDWNIKRETERNQAARGEAEQDAHASQISDNFAFSRHSSLAREE